MNNISSKKPKIAILLAAYNGEKFIEKQINSILSQEDVDLEIFISLDRSNDGSLELIKTLINKNSNIHLLPYGDKFGNAGKNFYRLISDVDFNKFNYIAFSDQDDFWLPKKIKTAIKKMTATNSACYSSDVLAVWPQTGRSAVIRKSQPQVKFDYIFEAAGPGCTYVIDHSFAESLQHFIQNNKSLINDIDLHDWFIYAYARSNGVRWVIDNQISMHYIQHSRNLVGVNRGIAAYKKRIKAILSWDWIKQVCSIYQVTKSHNIHDLDGLSVKNRKSLISIAIKSRIYRRKRIDALYLSLFMLILTLIK